MVGWTTVMLYWLSSGFAEIAVVENASFLFRSLYLPNFYIQR